MTEETTTVTRRSDRHSPRQASAVAGRLGAARGVVSGLGPQSRPGIVVAVVLLVFLVARPWLVRVFADSPALATWLTVLVSICLQALPFLVGGVLISAAIATFASPELLARILPRNPALAVPVAGLAGVCLPGCECASVPIAGSLVRRGMAPPAALTFLLAAPAINPVVLVSTAVAFPGNTTMVVARFLASLLASVTVGWLWLALGRGVPLRLPRAPSGAAPVDRFVAQARHDLLHAGGFLAVGAALAATVNVLVPLSILDAVAGSLLLSVLALALLAVLVAMCSEADAFVAASLSRFPAMSQLAFMVVGPAVDVKLASMQAGVFGRRFAMRFAPLTFVVAVAAAVLVGSVLLR